MGSTKQNSQPRTYARNRRAFSRRGNENVSESDGSYILKLVLYVVLGTLWLKFSTPVVWAGTPLSGFPIGLIIGLIVVRLVEKFQFDRKIWYAVLIIVAVVSYFVPAGIVI
ncbi:MAG: hypothetical protein ACSLEY_00220 [Candidatus Saccharimonadales bacterium]